VYACRDPRARCGRTEGRFDPYGNKNILRIYLQILLQKRRSPLDKCPTYNIDFTRVACNHQENPTGDLLLTQNKSPHKRCPLASTVSQDEGEIWRTFKNIETAERYNYAYPSVTFVEKEAFSIYWISHTVPFLPIDWFYARATSKTAILFHFVLYHSTD